MSTAPASGPTAGGVSAASRPHPPRPHRPTPRQRLADALGLSTSHISPRGMTSRGWGGGNDEPALPTGQQVEGTWACEVAVGGSLLAVKGRKPPDRKRGGGLRGKVQGFSKNSRRRLIRKLASIDRETMATPPIFGTLTYPGEWPRDPKRWKRDLDAWGKRLRRRHREACVIWKLEPQKRGAPHFHLLVFGVPHLDKHWLAASWYAVVDSGDVRHLRAGTRIESIRTWRGVMSYASKYTAKVIEELPEGWEEVGRMWGIIGKEKLPIYMVRFAVSREQALMLRGFLWDIIGGPPPGWIQFADDGLTAVVEWQNIATLLFFIFDGVRMLGEPTDGIENPRTALPRCLDVSICDF